MLNANHLKKSFDGLGVLRDISLQVNEGEVVAIIGKSGSGKSTLLRCLNNLEQVDGGTIEIDGQALVKDGVYCPPREQRAICLKMGYVFQNFNLFPHMNVLRNLTEAQVYVLKRDKEKAAAYARELLQKVGLADREAAYPYQLSGGQQQRVAIARALVKIPRVLLLDEPLSNLDARLRLQTREELRRIQRETGVTTIFVTHDQEEAMSISDLIVVMKEGILQQIGKPQDVYDEPANLFVAQFLGTPQINTFSGEIRKGQVMIGGEAVLDAEGREDRQVWVAIRPEGFIPDDAGPFTCRLDRIEVMGRDISVVATHESMTGRNIRAIISAENRIDTARDTVRFRLKPHKVFLFDRESEERV